MNFHLRWLLPLAALLVLGLAWLGPVDRLADEQSDAGLKRALATFAAARVLNGVISVAQGTEVAVDIEFKPVGVKMNIIPMIAGTDSVLLQIYADVSAVTGFADTDPVVTPITSQRTAVTTVYLKDKYTLVIGGLKSVTKFESETKVPLLGDIPILGWLFKHRSTNKTKSSLIVFVTPTIVRTPEDQDVHLRQVLEEKRMRMQSLHDAIFGREAAKK